VKVAASPLGVQPAGGQREVAGQGEQLVEVVVVSAVLAQWPSRV